MYRIELSHQVQKFLDRFDEKFVKSFYHKIEILRVNPFLRNISIDIKPMRGQMYHYRLRIRDYRFLYEVRKEEILIYFYKADKRGDVSK